MSPAEIQTFLAEEIVVEEKVDGANLGISVDHNGGLKLQNRGQYLTRPFSGQFSRLSSWLAIHEEKLLAILDSDLVLFGEWCAAKHSIYYSDLFDLFVLFDVYDRSSNRFWSSKRRNSLATEAGLEVVPEVFRGLTSIEALKDIVATSKSRYRNGSMEGVVVRRETPYWCLERAKLVRSDFTQNIGPHWRSRRIEWNKTK